MANIPLLRFDPPVPVRGDGDVQRDGAIGGNAPPQPGTLSVTTAGAVGLPVAIAIVLALLGAIQPFVNSWVTSRLQSRQEEARARTERTVAEAAWIRSALAVEDDTKREAALKFLVKAGLVQDPNKNLVNLRAAEIPFLRPAQPAAEQEIKDKPPPPPGSGRGAVSAPK
jgi:hypothetical protein